MRGLVAIAALLLVAGVGSRESGVVPTLAPAALTRDDVGAGVGTTPGSRLPTPAQPGTVRPDSFWSQALGTRKRFIVYLPPSYEAQPTRRYPVAFYLHGAYGDETNWTRQGRLDAVMDSLVAAGRPEMIVVMPDGDDGWYTTWNTLGDLAGCRRDRPPGGEPAATYCVPWPKYDDYIARDLVARVDSAYRTVPDRAHRGIAGLSMGGYGAVTLALRYPEVFAAAASHSGVLSPAYGGPRPFAPPVRYAASVDSLRAAYGARLWALFRPAFGVDTIAWFARDPAHLARALRRHGGPMPALFMDAGVDDRLVVDQGRALHAELTALGIAHHYAEWPGQHDWAYWRAHVGESLAWLGERLR